MPNNPPNKPTLDFPFPSVVVDTLLTERSSSFVGTWTPLEPGTPFNPLNHSVEEVTRYQGNIFLGQKAGKDNESQDRFWATQPHTQDIYNYAQDYTSDVDANPVFTRRYLELRDQYPALRRTRRQPFTGLYAIRVTNGGTGYSTDPTNPPTAVISDSGSGSGATAVVVVDPTTGAVVKLTLKTEGLLYTPTTVSIAITDVAGGTGVGATAVAVLQPVACVLISEVAVSAPAPWDSLYLLVTRVYETLPGPILFSIDPDPELGIPVMTTEQRRSSSDTWTCGEIAPVAFNISGATVAAQTVVTLSGYPTIPDIFVEEWVVIAGTANTTPTLNGTWKVVAVSGSTITLDKQITNVSGAVGGTARRYSYAYVARRKTENANVVMMVTTRAATNDITQYGQTTKDSRPYPFPDALLDIILYNDTASTTDGAFAINYAYSWSGVVGYKILPGFRGDCSAQKIRFFSMGPFTVFPTDPSTGLEYAATVVIPAVGTVTVQGGSFSKALNFNTLDETQSTSNTFKGSPVPPVLTSAYAGPTTVGTGQATFNIALPDSIVKDPGSAARKGFVQGDIIRVIDQVQKLRGTGVYMLTIWRIVCPYTTGVGPA